MVLWPLRKLPSRVGRSPRLPWRRVPPDRGCWTGELVAEPVAAPDVGGLVATLAGAGAVHAARSAAPNDHAARPSARGRLSSCTELPRVTTRRTPRAQTMSSAAYRRHSESLCRHIDPRWLTRIAR